MTKDNIKMTISHGGKSIETDSNTLSKIADNLTKDQVRKVVAKKESKPNIPGLGHNSDDDEAGDVAGVAGKRLLSFFDRVERLEEEKAALAEDIKDIFAEAKAAGFEVKIMRRIVKLRKREIEKRREEDELLNLYMSAIGME